MDTNAEAAIVERQYLVDRIALVCNYAVWIRQPNTAANATAKYRKGSHTLCLS
jgi:hypothetical protein